MSNKINRIDFPELFFGFVAPIGADLSEVIAAFRKQFQDREYNVIEIKLTDLFPIFSKYLKAEHPLKDYPLEERYISYIQYGNQLRKKFGNEVLAESAIARVVRNRVRRVSADEKFQKTVFLLHQFKRKEEIDLLRSVYGRLFFQISVYSRRGARVDFLARQIAKSNNSASDRQFRSFAYHLIEKDENEQEEPFGQRVGKIFHDADLIITLDKISLSIDDQVNRFCELLFWSNQISPSRMEYGLFLAKAASLRTLDLSRQVGAAIFSENGDVISLGVNEVPKAHGGSYWAYEDHDDREYKRGLDSNEQRKTELLKELLQLFGNDATAQKLISDQRIRDSQFMDALEYGRIVHAEMSAICDAARTGRSVQGATIYCTTFPCHMCAKHIVGSGIANVIFLEPYPKSLAYQLHQDSLEIEGEDRGIFKDYPAVAFEHFYGVTPRRYRELFEREKRKDTDGNFVPYGDKSTQNRRMPIIDIKRPFYAELETLVVAQNSRDLEDAINEMESPDGA